MSTLNLTEKRCSCCHRWKDMDQFPQRNDRPNGNGRASHCYDCKAAAHAARKRTDITRTPAQTLAEHNRQDLAATLAFALWFGPVSRGTLLTGMI